MLANFLFRSLASGVAKICEINAVERFNSTYPGNHQSVLKTDMLKFFPHLDQFLNGFG